jgi:hypothetical protein
MLGKLPKDVYDEITNPDFVNLKHGSIKTYDKGCHGPLCRKKRRERGRIAQKHAGTYVSPEKEAELQRIIDWLAETPRLSA